MEDQAAKKSQAMDTPQEDFRDFFNQLLLLLPPRSREVVIQYYREILAGILAIVLGLILMSGYTHYRESQEKNAATLFGMAIYETAPEKRIKILKQLINQHGSTDAARLARLLLAKAMYENNDLKRAMKHFEDASRKEGKHSILRQTALLGLGYLLEEQGQLNEAIKKFDDAVKVSRGLEHIALMDKARVAKSAGKKETALNAFNTLLSENPSPQDLDFIKSAILELKRSEKTGTQGARSR